LKTRGLRMRVWYWALDRMERGLVDLTIRWVDKVRSGRMAETLMRILEKLAQALKTDSGRVQVKGRTLAAGASGPAQCFRPFTAVRTGFSKTLALEIVGLS